MPTIGDTYNGHKGPVVGFPKSEPVQTKNTKPQPSEYQLEVNKMNIQLHQVYAAEKGSGQKYTILLISDDTENPGDKIYLVENQNHQKMEVSPYDIIENGLKLVVEKKGGGVGAKKRATKKSRKTRRRRSTKK